MLLLRYNFSVEVLSLLPPSNCVHLCHLIGLSIYTLVFCLFVVVCLWLMHYLECFPGFCFNRVWTIKVLLRLDIAFYPCVFALFNFCCGSTYICGALESFSFLTFLEMALPISILPMYLCNIIATPACFCSGFGIFEKLFMTLVVKFVLTSYEELRL